MMNSTSLGVCLCCFKEVGADEDVTEITSSISKWFIELFGFELTRSYQRNRIVCDVCYKDLKHCIDFRDRIIQCQQKSSIEAVSSCDDPLESYVEVKLENAVSNEITEAATVDESSELHLELTKSNTKKSKTRKQCPTCGIFVINLPEHQKMVHQACKRFCCDYCSYSCYFKTKISRHLQRHIPKHLRKRYPCEVENCNFFATRKDALRSHVSTMHQVDRGKVCLCVECGKRFFNKTQLKCHYKSVHEKIKNHLCNFCGKSFFNLKDMEMHVKRHGSKDQACDICGNLFYCSLDLRRHMKIHSDPTIECEVQDCSKKFYTNSKMKMHVKIRHEGVKDFFCDYCSSKFSQHNNLQRHVNSVHKSLRINCLVSGCSYSVARKDKYKNHLASQHKFLDDHTKESILKSVKFE